MRQQSAEEQEARRPLRVIDGGRAPAPGARSRVLYFAPRECWPPDTGQKLRNYHLAKQLGRGTRVTYLGFADERSRLAPEAEPPADPAGVTQRHIPRSAAEPMVPLLYSCEEIVTVPRDGGYSIPALLRGLLGPTPVTVLNYTTEPMRAELLRLVDERRFDLVQVEGIHLFGYLPELRAAVPRPLLVCDWHNVESEIMARFARKARNPARRLYAGLTAKRMAHVERLALEQFDAHTVVSERDRDHLLAIAPNARVFVIDNGVDVSHFSNDELRAAGAATPADGRRVLFVGSMDYHANVEAVVHFAREVWPAVRAVEPSLTFTIVGRRPAPEVAALASQPGIEVTGTVADVRPYYHDALAAVVPLRVGGGSRLKILEAMAAGVPVVSTRLGAEGLDVRDRESVLLAETAGEFAHALQCLEGDAALHARIAAGGRRLVSERYDWRSLGDRLLEVHMALLDERRGAAAPRAEARAA